MGIAFGKGLFVAVADKGAILTSTNAAAWTQQMSATTNPLADIAFGNGRFIATGVGGTVVSSTNGTNWTEHSVGSSAFLTDVHFVNDAFVAVNRLLKANQEVFWTKSAMTAITSAGSAAITMLEVVCSAMKCAPRPGQLSPEA